MRESKALIARSIELKEKTDSLIEASKRLKFEERNPMTLGPLFHHDGIQ